MPFTRRPDTWLILSGSTAARKRPATDPTSADDLLSEFASETPTQIIAAEKPIRVILVPGVPAASSAVRSDVTTTHIQNVSIDRLVSIQPPTRRTSERVRLVANAAACARKTCAIAADLKTIPSWLRRVGAVGRLATTTSLIAFAFGAAGGVVATWIASAPPSSTAVPIASHTFLPRTSSPRPDLPASRADAWAAAEGVRPVGTSGRQASGLNQRVRPSRSASSRSATRGTISPPSYRGSLAFRSAPQGAKVFVNGTFVGSTPLVLENLPVGSRAVRFEADGYQRWSTSTRVVADQQTGVSATLAPARP